MAFIGPAGVAAMDGGHSAFVDDVYATHVYDTHDGNQCNFQRGLHVLQRILGNAVTADDERQFLGSDAMIYLGTLKRVPNLSST